jgi:hypothetical protein
MNTPLYLVTQAGFILLTILSIGLFVREIAKGVRLTSWDKPRRKRFMTFLLGTIFLWAAFVVVWSLSGRMGDFSLFPLNLFPVLAIPIVTLVVFINSRNWREVSQHIPPASLIRLQSFRFGVEVLLWMLFIGNLLPEQMTFEGRNFDILAGISAPVIASLAMRGKISKKGIVAWNVICLGLLLNIVIIAILSTPSPWRVFTNEPANYIVTYFPISLLPGFLVPLAYYLHVISIMQMGRNSGMPSGKNDASLVTAEK